MPAQARDDLSRRKQLAISLQVATGFGMWIRQGKSPLELRRIQKTRSAPDVNSTSLDSEEQAGRRERKIVPRNPKVKSQFRVSSTSNSYSTKAGSGASVPVYSLLAQPTPRSSPSLFGNRFELP